MKKQIIPFIILSWIAIHSECSMYAQPYIDLINVRYTNSPETGPVSKNKNETQLNYLNISSTLPIRFKNKKDALILSPFFEKWTSLTSVSGNYSNNHYGLVLPVSLLKTIPNSNWSLMTTAIVRMNDANINANGQWQFGGALVAAYYKKNSHLTYKMGLYINGEFFGLFIIPLLGIDWQINERNNLFGILPASLTWEHQFNHRLYAGTVFRTFTNSYHDGGPNYWRVDENQLGVFADYYFGKHLVLNLEAGHSLFRKIRSGERNEVKNNWNADDNFYFKCMIAYRIRFR
ncbi:MAG TPA: DUF6268 family outer membrane beta-barrel protein [Puia sp.]|nr:DUF6268 family outer membrane beta-barrel protein [Puia sp.]